MKKVLSWLLVFSMVFAFVTGCGKKTEESAPAPDESPAAEGTEPETQAVSDSEPVTIRIAHMANEQEAIHQGFLKFKEVMEGANVNVTVEIYPAKQLVGSDADAIEACQLGEIDMTSVAEMQFAPFCQAFYVFNANYLFDSIDDARANLEGEFGQALKQAAKDDGLGVEVATFFGGSLRGIFTTNKTLRTPADIKGVKMRTADNPINIAELEALGASAIIMAGGECYTGFQQGAIEGWISAMTSHVDQGYMDVCSHVCDTWHTIYIPTVLINSEKLASLSVEQRAAYDEAIAAATEVQWSQVSGEMDGLYEKLRTMQDEGKAVFSELTDEERAQWKEVMVNATEDMVKEKLGDFTNLLDMMREK